MVIMIVLMTVGGTSALLQVALPEIPPGWNQAGPAAAAGDTANPPAMPEVLGWEANNEGKLKAR